ncbi:helix-turn-helix domain-containing protein [Paludifilum halophilum]|uniref:Uncharacterized protein n=1 Tax=Paludifilum halophilum TaxID=1642702 RepID=A0A235B9L8_9BACL|nr:helix-turn-helix domain-containing protein [Paludifilum halophilum]OYD08587.1 hypothetical protein CHM34_07115 [Paludifilum halophilum]
MLHKKVIEKLRGYQKHKSFEEVSRSVKSFLDDNLVTETQLRALRVIQHHGKIVPGVALLKYETIAEYVGVTRRTVITAVKKLTEFGIIEKHAQTRELQGGDGANIFCIVVFTPNNTPDYTSKNTATENASTPADTGSEADNSGAEYVEYVEYEENMSSKDYVHTYKDAYGAEKDRANQDVEIREDVHMGKELVPHMVPSEFSDFVGRYLKNALDIVKLYERAILATRKLGDIHVRDELALDAFKSTLFAYKSGRVRGDFFGYFYGTYYRLAEQEQVVEVRRESMGDMPSWLSSAMEDHYPVIEESDLEAEEGVYGPPDVDYFEYL